MSTPQPFPYSQTILLDCNRRSSVEFSASNLANTNTAIFTNQISSGITLDIGDQVSIQSAHISQRGAGGDVIEFAGNTLGQKNVSYTEQTNVSFVGFDVFVVSPGAESIQTSPEGFAYETNETKEELIQMKDNEASVIINYYKNTNGENYIGLPRNFASASSRQNLTAYGGGGLGGAGASFNHASEYYEVRDGYPVGANVYPQQASHVLADDWYVYEGKNINGDDCEFRKIKNDNSRFTLFKQDRIVWNSEYVTNASVNEYLTASYCNPTLSDHYKCDPAVRNYLRVRKKIDLSVPVGYNSPNSIAADITNQLTKTDDPVNINSYNSAFNSVYINSTLNRAFPCTNYNNMRPDYAALFFNADNTLGSPDGADGPPPINGAAATMNRATQYLNSYAYVGFKRPEYVEAGREAFPLSIFTTYTTQNTINSANASTADIITNITYNDENLLKLKKLFDAQKLYPELLTSAIKAGVGVQTNYSASVNPNSASLSASFLDEARFIHLDLKKVGITQDPIGDDMYNASRGFSVSVNSPPLSSASDLSSVPLFFAFNNNSSHLTAEKTLGNNYGNLAYGFAKRAVGIIDDDLIAFTTEKIGGIPSSYFSENGGTIPQETRIGYDYHFNAYGNAAIIPSSGFAPVQYFGKQAFTSAQTCRNVYIGANDPAFKFNDIEGRFEIENLHTSEKVGNFYNSGDPTPSAAIFAPPPSAQAGEDCYKIDKQLHYTTFSPYMFPYSAINIKHNTDTNDAKTFVKVNENLEVDTIYDAQCGVMLEDMGFDEKNWGQGFWGLLGYQYGQFNASGDDIKNSQILFHGDSSNVIGMTTNADITSVASQSYITNVFGTNLFTNMLNSRVGYYDKATVDFQTFSTTTASYTIAPSSVILSNSTRIIAKELPRKILRGYFLINSDILDQANFYQTANPLQTMAMVGKYNGANDFIQYDGGGAVFTVTRKKTITSVKTEILDPEGGLAQVGDNSGIVYRVDKQINTDLKFAENLFSQMNNK